jgi:hypothetical protein
MRQIDDDYLNQGFKEDVIENVMYRNAESVLQFATPKQYCRFDIPVSALLIVFSWFLF